MSPALSFLVRKGHRLKLPDSCAPGRRTWNVLIEDLSVTPTCGYPCPRGSLADTVHEGSGSKDIKCGVQKPHEYLLRRPHQDPVSRPIIFT